MKNNVPVQSLIDHIKTALDVDPWAKEMVEELLNEQPEIIRCKDCTYYTGGIDGYCDRWFRRSGGNMAFCSEGERKKQTAE